MNFIQRKGKKRIGSIILVLILVMGLISISGCKKEQISELSIGVMADVGAVPFIIAAEKGYFKEVGIDVDLEVFKSALDRDSGLQTGNLQGAMADMMAVLFFNEAGVKMKVTSATYGNYMMVTSPSLNLDTFLNSEKKTIGLSTNTVIDFATSLIAEEKGFTSQLVKTAIPQMPVRLEMLKNNELTGATLPEPLASIAKLEGGSIVGDTEELGLYPGIMLFSEDAIKNKPKEITKFYEAYNKAVDYINNEDIDTYFDVLVEKLSFPPVLKDSFKMPVFEHAIPGDEHTFNITMNWMIDDGLIKDTYSFSDISNTEFIKN